MWQCVDMSIDWLERGWGTVSLEKEVRLLLASCWADVVFECTLWVRRSGCEGLRLVDWLGCMSSVLGLYSALSLDHLCCVDRMLVKRT